MIRPVHAGDYVAHFDPQLDHHRAWLLVVLERLVVNEPQALEEGGSIGQEQADGVLAGRLERDGAWRAMRISGWAALSCHKQAALLSFTYNCVPNWFGSNGFATLSRCLLQGVLGQVPAALLLLCVNSGGPSEAGPPHPQVPAGCAHKLAADPRAACRPSDAQAVSPAWSCGSGGNGRIPSDRFGGIAGDLRGYQAHRCWLRLKSWS